MNSDQDMMGPSLGVTLDLDPAAHVSAPFGAPQ